MGKFGITELLVILVIIILLFGTKRLRSLGGDLGGAIKGFRKSMGNEEEKPEELSQPNKNASQDNDSSKPE